MLLSNKMLLVVQHYEGEL